MTKKQILIDVRETDEYLEEHVEGAINIPMSTIQHGGKEKFKSFADHEIIILCQSGDRAEMCKKIIEHGCDCDVRVFAGGLLNWKKQGKETFGNQSGTISIMRQVQIAVGSMVATFSLLAYFVNINFIFGALAISTGLFIAGITGTCLLAKIIALLPYNNVK